MDDRTIASDFYPRLIDVLIQDPFAEEKSVIEDGIAAAILEYGDVVADKALFLDKYGKQVYAELSKKVISGINHVFTFILINMCFPFTV